eukprot:TRINITY_DN1562_c0_g1_i1.p1 TRINITY_DN1562_c0_g1~~TRINITY_DN1562_c0_g1_i1.p1  ORF type:complete len:479 (+),score=101.12 TRINITY_DN1562_c0_g1_i1:47-1483(+)
MNRLVSVVFFALCISCGWSTPLDDYVNMVDTSYNWTLHSSFSSWLGYKAYVLDLTSQTWMTRNESNHPTWRHWLTICVPDVIDPKASPTAFMYIDGGHISDPAPTSVDLLAEVVCLNTRTVSAALLTIPNEALIFENDGVSRSEDGLIAYTWRHFINNTKEPIWLARLPMTKAAVKAMDAIQEFTATLPHVPTIKDFVVAGASKRGWTTWTTGAVDKRVKAMVPMVMPILNMIPNMNHHYQAYDGWSFALDDYLKQGLMAFLNTPQFQALADIVDPWTYRDRLTMPKLILTAAGDEFFLPDSPQFFMGGLPGENMLTVIPDAEHSLATALLDVGETISTYHHMIVRDIKRPKYTYQIIRSNTTASIVVTSNIQPAKVTLWYAHSWGNVLRDFRLVACAQIPECLQPVMWWPTDITLSPSGENTWTAHMNAPYDGWLAFLIELRYDLGSSWDSYQLRVSSEVNIVPDRMPFPPCGNHCQ